MRAPNRSNWTIGTGDSLDIMRGMDSGSADPIYLYPSFDSKADHAASGGSRVARDAGPVRNWAG